MKVSWRPKQSIAPLELSLKDAKELLTFQATFVRSHIRLSVYCMVDADMTRICMRTNL